MPKIESISQVTIKQKLVESEVVSIRQLKVMDKELKIKNYVSMTKQQLIEKSQGDMCQFINCPKTLKTP